MSGSLLTVQESGVTSLKKQREHLAVIDFICDRFEQAWAQSQEVGTPAPQIEDYLQSTAPELSTELFRELLRCELEHRREKRDTLALEDYLARFPHEKDVLTEFFPLCEDSSLPREVGRFQVERVLSEGGMGCILLAHDPDLDRPIAIKVLRRELRHEPRAVHRLAEEARLTGQLEHPSIPPVHEVSQCGDLPFFAMKLINGDTLANLLENRRSPGEELPTFLSIFVQICQTMAYAHSLGVIHRDLKPHNIMVGKFGEVQVLDWGLAKVLGDTARPCAPSPRREDDPDQTVLRSQEGDVFGTPAYMPPEQARGQVEQVDRRSDVFGLGAILCEILTGSPPYRARETRDALRKAMRADLTDAVERLRGCQADPALIHLAEKCLAPEKTDRPADAGAVAEAVAGYLAAVQERLQEERLAREREQVQVKEERRRRKLWVSLAAAVLMVIGLTTVGGLYLHNEKALHVQGLTDMLDRAESQLRSNALVELKELLNQAEGRLKTRRTPELSLRFENLRSCLTLVEDLDKVRLLRATWRNGAYDCSSALGGYEKAFARAGMEPLTEDISVVARQIRHSVVSDRLIAALDDWASVVDRERQKAKEENKPAEEERHRHERDRLLQLARMVDPDPELKDRIRNPQLWDQPALLKPLVAKLVETQPSAELLVLVGKLLRPEDAEDLWRLSLARHPRDFWLHIELGTLLMKRISDADPMLRTKLATEAAGYYQVGLALRSDTVGVYLDLSVAHRIKGDPQQAISCCRQAIAFDRHDAEAHEQLGLAFLAKGKRDEAVANFRKALELAERCHDADTCKRARGRIRECGLPRPVLKPQ